MRYIAHALFEIDLDRIEILSEYNFIVLYPTEKGIILFLKSIFLNLDKSSKYVRICQKVKVIAEGIR